MRLWVPGGLLLCCLLALGLRAPDLGNRPFHNDEAVNAIKFRALWEDGVYSYDPNEHHGPTLPYATLLLARVSAWGPFAATQEWQYRSVSLLAGLLMILALWLVRDGLGGSGTVWAGLLTALSPSLVFFSRDYIHEILLLAGTLVFLGGLWRYWVKPGWSAALWAGVGLGLMHATKETFVLNVGAAGVAGAGCWLWRRLEAPEPRVPRKIPMPHLLVGLATWLLVATTLLSGFYTNPHGLWDSVLTYLPWLERAGGDTPHVHPALFYWERLFWFSDGTGLASTELLLAVLAGVGAVVAVRKRGYGDARLGWLRFILIYTLVLGALYSSIPYKTPWCVLGVVQGLTLLGGAGAAALFRSVRRPVFRLGLGVALGVLLGHLGWQAWSLSQTRASDRGNPWAYAATSEDIENLVAQVERIAASHPRGHGMDLQVACAEDDYWPLPFSLRAFSQVGWWSQVPPPPWAPVLIVSPAFGPDVEATGNTVNAGYYQLRPGVFRLLYVDRDLWTRVVAGGARGVRQVEGALEDP